MVPCYSKLIFGLLLAIGCSFLCAEQLDANLTNHYIALAQSNALTSIAKPIPVAAVDVEKEDTSMTSSKTSALISSITTTIVVSTTTLMPAITTATTTNATAISPISEHIIGSWNSSCIMIMMTAQLTFTYYTKDNRLRIALLNIPTDAKVGNSSCEGHHKQNILITWGPIDAINTMILQFDMKERSVQMTMVSINISLNSYRFLDAKENQTIQLSHRGIHFRAPRKMSYHCIYPRELQFTESNANVEPVHGKMIVRNVQVQAFLPAHAEHFSAAHDCNRPETDFVPLAVGFTFTVLIIIILVANSVARSHFARGYMSF
ncbi:lysosome-associated membrane glycoprotein 1-like [Teleopsis dalmanni]|uniref:lysosome-associated membrane glycoprotein 1-like n=1 Tax=Teleopsis dalmanni TaxID=139649 RepID=UPI0018CCA618|nr:lysosome-associated membrane glycoprotein 1-like [Teleopsis dalmanni]